MVLSDECELVSAFLEKEPFMQHKVAATRRGQLGVGP